MSIVKTFTVQYNLKDEDVCGVSHKCNDTAAKRLTLYIGDLSTKNMENRLPFELQC